MKAKNIALTTAAAIATAGLTPTTAQADPARDMVGLIIGFAALAAIADAANNNNTRVIVTHGNTPRYSNRNNYRNNNDRHDHRNSHANRHQLPQQCKVSERTRRGWISYYNNRCMARLGWIQTRNGWVRDNHARW